MTPQFQPDRYITTDILRHIAQRVDGMGGRLAVPEGLLAELEECGIHLLTVGPGFNTEDGLSVAALRLATKSGRTGIDVLVDDAVLAAMPPVDLIIDAATTLVEGLADAASPQCADFDPTDEAV